MQKIWLFILRFNSLFVFLLLEGIALYLYFNTNTTSQKLTFLSSANSLIGNVYDYSSDLSSYWNLESVNDSLAKENARLKMELPSSQFSHLINKNEVQDSFYEQAYEYVEAEIVRNNIHTPRNFITINRGSAHGVEENNGVLGEHGKGIVGITRKVSTNYSVLMSILNKDIRISAKIKRNNYFGTLTWDGNSLEQMVLESVPKHASIEEGDTIITSGFSTIFPEGVEIGYIDTFEIASGSNFYTAKVRLKNDVSQASYVYVVNDLFKQERKKLEQEVVE